MKRAQKSYSAAQAAIVLKIFDQHAMRFDLGQI
jgi:hypothetical protein